MQVACLPVDFPRVAASDTAYQISFAAIVILNGYASTLWDASNAYCLVSNFQKIPEWEMGTRYLLAIEMSHLARSQQGMSEQLVLCRCQIKRRRRRL